MTGDIFVVQRSNINYINETIHNFLLNNYEELLKDVIKPSPESFGYLLLLHILGLEGVAEIPNIDIKKFTKNLKYNGTLRGLEEILLALFRPLQIIITNPEPAVIDIIIDSPTQLDLENYTNIDDEEYLNDPSNRVYQALQLSNLDNTTSDSFSNLLSLFIPIGTFFTLHTIPYQEIFMPDYFLRQYICAFFSLSADTNPVVLSMIVSDYVNTIILEDERYTSLIGLELATGIKNLSIMNSLSDDLDLSPVYDLELITLKIYKNTADGNLFTANTYQEVILDNTNTLSLDFLSDSINLRELTIASELGILDFRPLINCTSLITLDTNNNNYTIPDPILEDETIIGKYEVNIVQAYDIDGTLLEPIEISDNGIYSNGKITWTNLSIVDNYEISYKLGKPEIQEPVMPINDSGLMHIEEDDNVFTIDPNFEKAIRIMNNLSDSFVIDEAYLSTLDRIYINKTNFVDPNTNLKALKYCTSIRYFNINLDLDISYLSMINSIPWTDITNSKGNSLYINIDDMNINEISADFINLVQNLNLINDDLSYNINFILYFYKNNNISEYVQKICSKFCRMFPFKNLTLGAKNNDLDIFSMYSIEDIIPPDSKLNKLEYLYLDRLSVMSLKSNDQNHLSNIHTLTISEGYYPVFPDDRDYWLFSLEDVSEDNYDTYHIYLAVIKVSNDLDDIVNIKKLFKNLSKLLDDNKIGDVYLSFMDCEFPENFKSCFTELKSSTYTKNCTIDFTGNYVLSLQFIADFNKKNPHIQIARD